MIHCCLNRFHQSCEIRPVHFTCFCGNSSRLPFSLSAEGYAFATSGDCGPCGFRGGNAVQNHHQLLVLAQNLGNLEQQEVIGTRKECQKMFFMIFPMYHIVSLDLSISFNVRIGHRKKGPCLDLLFFHVFRGPLIKVLASGINMDCHALR